MLLREGLIALKVASNDKERDQIKASIKKTIKLIERDTKENGINHEMIMARGCALLHEVEVIMKSGRMTKYHTPSPDIERFWVYPLEENTSGKHKFVLMNDLLCLLGAPRPPSWLVGVGYDHHMNVGESIDEFKRTQDFNISLYYIECAEPAKPKRKPGKALKKLKAAKPLALPLYSSN